MSVEVVNEPLKDPGLVLVAEGALVKIGTEAALVVEITEVGVHRDLPHS